MIIWLTGQPGSGKTTLARELKKHGIVDFVVDGDELRAMRPTGYDYYSRHENVERAQSIADWLDWHGHNVAVAVVAPHRKQRFALRDKVNEYIEIYLHGRHHHEPHRLVSDYEKPTKEEALRLNTALCPSIEMCVDRIVAYIEGED